MADANKEPPSADAPWGILSPPDTPEGPCHLSVTFRLPSAGDLIDTPLGHDVMHIHDVTTLLQPRVIPNGRAWPLRDGSVPTDYLKVLMPAAA